MIDDDRRGIYVFSKHEITVHTSELTVLPSLFPQLSAEPTASP